MFYSATSGSSSSKQTSVATTDTRRFNDMSLTGKETYNGSSEHLNVSESRDLSGSGNQTSVVTTTSLRAGYVASNGNEGENRSLEHLNVSTSREDLARAGKQTSVATTSARRSDYVSSGGNEVENRSLEHLNVSTSREDLSRAGKQGSVAATATRRSVDMSPNRNEIPTGSFELLNVSTSRNSSRARKQTSVATRSARRFDDMSPSGNESFGSMELLNMSTSREDLSRGVSRCSCHSGESGNVKNDTKTDEYWMSANLKAEFDNNGGSDDELLKDELLRIFDRERFGLETYFKQKTERILQGYRRKQYEWEERVRLEKIEHEKLLSQEKVEVQQNYISEMTKLTKQFNQERVELENHYKKQISELTHQFEMRKKEMDETIIKERTELKQRLELEYQSMLKSQQTVDQQQFRQQMSELEEGYKNKIYHLEQKLKEAMSESDLTGRRMEADLQAKFENEKASLVGQWRKRVELLELELGREKERANKEERKVFDSHGFLRSEVTKKDAEIEKLRQIVETLKAEVLKNDKTAKDFEMLQQNIFLRGSEALPGKLREDFERMLAAHRQDLEQASRKEREGLETERERRMVLERETLEKQLKMEKEKMELELEKERGEMRRISREKEESLREEMKREMEEMKRGFENENRSLREQVKEELGKERIEIRERFLQEKNERDKEMERQFKKVLVSQEEGKRRDLERDEDGKHQKMEDTKQWVEKHITTEVNSGAVGDSWEWWAERDQMGPGRNNGAVEDSRGSDRKERDVVGESESRDQDHQVIVLSGLKMGNTVPDSSQNIVKENNVTNVMVTMDNDKNDEYGLRDLEEENEGLKTKVVALQENIKLHECYKTEARKEIERLRKTSKELKEKMEEMKEKLNEYEERFEDYEERLEDRERKIEEYEKICSDYEKCIGEYREKILVIEKDRKMPSGVRQQDENDRQHSAVNVSRKNGVASKDTKIQEMRSVERVISRDVEDNKKDEDNSHRRPNIEYQQIEIKNEPMVDILQDEKRKLQRVVENLEDKIGLLEKKILEISTVETKVESRTDSEEKRRLKSSLVKIQRQNRDLVDKVKGLQYRLQGMVDKLKKEKKKVTYLQKELRSVKLTRQSEFKELRRKLEYSGKVIERLQSASVESDVVKNLQEEISSISKLMMEERLNEQKMRRARSIEEVNKFQELDRDKSELEKKLYEAKLALDGYSSRLRQSASRAEFTSSQFNSQNNSFLRDIRLSKTIEALGESQKTSVRQNERLLREKKELQSLIGRLCKSEEDLRGSGEYRLTLSSRSSSISSLSSSSSDITTMITASGFHGNKVSSSFSFFD